MTCAPPPADVLNPGIHAADAIPTYHSTLTDNNMVAGLLWCIQLVIQCSTYLCYLLYVYPQRGIHIPSLSEEKYVLTATWCMDQLGLDLGTRCLQVIYPPSKHKATLACIDAGWSARLFHTQREIATLLGHTRTLVTILPLGAYINIRIQQWLNSHLVTFKKRVPPALDILQRTKMDWRSHRKFVRHCILRQICPTPTVCWYHRRWTPSEINKLGSSYWDPPQPMLPTNVWEVGVRSSISNGASRLMILPPSDGPSSQMSLSNTNRCQKANCTLKSWILLQILSTSGSPFAPSSPRAHRMEAGYSGFLRATPAHLVKWLMPLALAGTPYKTSPACILPSHSCYPINFHCHLNSYTVYGQYCG